MYKKNLMPMKQKKLMFAAAMLAVLPAAADDGLVMKVTAHDATSQSVGVVAGDVLDFKDAEMRLMSGDEVKASFPLSEIGNLSFSPPASVGSLTGSDAIRPLRNPVGDALEIAAPSGEEYTLYIHDMAGMLVLRVNAWKGEPVNVSALSPGIYLVTLNNTTFKILKK